ncbi:hypothetical protein H8356DRAFT_1424423 [Neocallimastix lanati (nom. inval.)]|nr:hypothetical protein H8356DRAFT_1424423 [Neocallimastix sp. JGI-2020a]
MRRGKVYRSKNIIIIVAFDIELGDIRNSIVNKRFEIVCDCIEDSGEAKASCIEIYFPNIPEGHPFDNTGITDHENLYDHMDPIENHIGTNHMEIHETNIHNYLFNSVSQRNNRKHQLYTSHHNILKNFGINYKGRKRKEKYFLKNSKEYKDDFPKSQMASHQAVVNETSNLASSTQNYEKKMMDQYLKDNLDRNQLNTIDNAINEFPEHGDTSTTTYQLTRDKVNTLNKYKYWISLDLRAAHNQITSLIFHLIFNSSSIPFYLKKFNNGTWSN